MFNYASVSIVASANLSSVNVVAVTPSTYLVSVTSGTYSIPCTFLRLQFYMHSLKAPANMKYKEHKIRKKTIDITKIVATDKLCLDSSK
jgi:hypothetical protein